MIWPVADFHVGFQPKEKAGFPAGFRASKLALRVCGYSRAVLWEVEERVIFQRRIACSAASFLRFRDAKEA